MRRAHCYLLGLMFLTSAFPALVAAHPHMWIREQLIPEMGSRGLEGVRVIWNIDELTSSALILDFDSNRNGIMEPSEIDQLRREAFEHLISAEYYLLIEVQGMLATPARARDFTARIRDRRLIYDFRVPLEIPIRWQDMDDVSIFSFDKTYFIDFRPDDLQEASIIYDRKTIVFTKTTRRLPTIGWGLVNLTGLAVTGVYEQ